MAMTITTRRRLFMTLMLDFFRKDLEANLEADKALAKCDWELLKSLLFNMEVYSLG